MDWAGQKYRGMEVAGMGEDMNSATTYTCTGPDIGHQGNTHENGSGTKNARGEEGRKEKGKLRKRKWEIKTKKRDQQ